MKPPLQKKVEAATPVEDKVKKCRVENGYVVPCHYLEKALDERAIQIRVMCDMKTGDEKGTLVFCSTGDYRKRNMGMLFCPFCGCGIHSATAKEKVEDVVASPVADKALIHTEERSTSYNQTVSVILDGKNIGPIENVTIKQHQRSFLRDDGKIFLPENGGRDMTVIIDRMKF